MSRHSFRHAYFLAGLMAASAAYAGSDIVKCVDPSGHVTLTDEPCRDGAATLLVPASDNSAPAAAPEDPPATIPAVTRVTTTERVAATPRVRRDTWVKKAAPDRMLARDVATLKAAYSSMQLMDSNASSARRTRLAGLN